VTVRVADEGWWSPVARCQPRSGRRPRRRLIGATEIGAILGSDPSAHRLFRAGARALLMPTPALAPADCKGRGARPEPKVTGRKVKETRCAPQGPPAVQPRGGTGPSAVTT
jgi:hypothetical protein